MKIKLLFAFLAFSLLSCSSDDSSNNNETPVVEKHIKEIAFYYPINLEGDMQYLGLKKYENGVPIEEYYGFEGNNYESANTKILYTYDVENKLTEMSWEEPDVTLYYTFEYDDLGRLTYILSDGYQNFFNYDTPNQISVSNSASGNDPYSIRYLDNEGYIYKASGVSENSNFAEATFENGNIVSVSSFQYDESTGEYVATLIRSYAYDMENEVKGEYNFTNITSNAILALEKNLFGSNNANAALFNGGFSDKMVNYPIEFYNSQSPSSNPSRNRTYEFDDDGYPIKSQWIAPNGEIYIEEYITYYE